MNRCQWAGTDEDMVKYHDEEWGVLVHDDKKMFEFIVLESAQAGLSWKTILKRRHGYRKAFANFDYVKVSKFTDKDVRRLMEDVGIIRNRLKIESTISNAKYFIKIIEEFGSFYNYVKTFVKKQVNNSIKTMKDIPATSELSDRMSLDLKKRGFKFMGSTILYAHLQATGVVNDHENNCFRKKACVKGAL